MSCCDGNAPPAAAKCGSGACGDDQKKSAKTPVPAVAPEKPPQGEGAGGCENACKCGANCNCNPCTCNNNK